MILFALPDSNINSYDRAQFLTPPFDASLDTGGSFAGKLMRWILLVTFDEGL